MTVFIQSGSLCLVAIVMATTVVADDVVNDNVAAEASTELSGPLLDQIEYPVDRPSWVGDDPDFESSIHTWVVSTGPRDSVDECAEKLKELTCGTVASYIERLIGTDRIDVYPVNDVWIEKRLIADSYTGPLKQAGEEMFESAVLLEFTPGTQKEIDAAWNKIQVRERLGALGVLVFFGLVGLIGCSTVLGMISRRAEQQA